MTLPEGSALGPYEVLYPIGAGGMGEVYRARDPRLRRDVAIKILPGSFAGDPERLRRFEQEAHTAGGLNHPNVLAIYDIGTHEGTPYVVSELLLGQTLRARLEQGPLPLRRAVEYAVQVARGLDAAHQKGIVHRDLKPDNIFLTDDGHLKILDFGLARPPKPQGAAAGATSVSTIVVGGTQPGVILGTAGYMSPEQVRGAAADHRSDIFSFGVVLYEMLTGKRAFEGDSAVETMNAILRDDLPELGAWGRPVPLAIERVVRRCVEKNPDERFQSARDLGFALDALSGPSDPGTQKASGTSRRWAGRWLWTTAVLLAGVLAGAALAAWALRPRVMDPPAFRYLTYSGHDYAPDASPDGRVVAFTSDRDGRPRIWLKQLAGGEERPVTQGPDDFARFSPDGSALLYAHQEGARSSIYRLRLLGGEPRKLIDDAREGDWSPDGERIAFVRWKPTNGRSSSAIGLASADGDNAREIARFDRALERVRWSPDGSLIAAIETAGASPVLITADGQTQPSPAVRGGPAFGGAGFAISSLAWLRAPDEVVYLQTESALGGGLGTNAGPANLVRQNIRSGEARIVAWSPGSSTLLDIVGPGRVVFDTCSPRASLREFRLGPVPEPAAGRWLTRGNSNDRQPAYSPDGEWVIFASNRSGNLDLWAISAKTDMVRRLTEDEAEDWDPAYTGNHRIVWSSNRSGRFEIYIAEPDGSGARRVTDDGVDAENPTATPDGGWIVYASANPAKEGIWKIRPDGTQARRLAAGSFTIPEVSPDGRYALFTVDYGTERVRVRVVELDTGQVLPFEIGIGARPVRGVTLGRARWMPGGRAIAFIGQDEKGVAGVFAQDFAPGRDTRTTRRKLGGFDPELITESFGISPDGSRVSIASWEQLFSLMLAERLPGIEPPQRR